MLPIKQPPTRSARAAEAGFSLFELMIAASVLAIALLGHTASIFSEHRLSTAEKARSTALLASEQFLERMRSDEDWASLYSRLVALKLAASKPGGEVHLDDHRRAYVPQVYFDDFVTPSGLGSFHVLVDVPCALATGEAEPAPVLREDLPLPLFGLPYDLDGDGVIDDAPHDDDYRALPIVITFRWTAGAEAPSEIRMSSWLWGNR